MHKTAILFMLIALNRIILLSYSCGPESPSGYITTCLKIIPPTSTLFRFHSILFQCLSHLAGAQFAHCMTCLKMQIHRHDEQHIRCSAECSFPIYRWFYLMHSSIPSWSTNIFFCCLAGTQFSDCFTCLTTGFSMNILHQDNNWPMQRGFFTNGKGDLLPTLGFLGGLSNFCNFAIIFSLM